MPATILDILTIQDCLQLHSDTSAANVVKYPNLTAIAYAMTLEQRFFANVYKIITS